MTSFNEGDVNRDASGKFAAKTTGETDAHVLDGGGWDDIKNGLDESDVKEHMVRENARDMSYELTKSNRSFLSSAVDRLSEDRQVVAYGMFRSNNPEDIGSYVRKARSLNDQSAKRLATQYARGAISEITVEDVESSPKRSFGQRLRARFFADK